MSLSSGVTLERIHFKYLDIADRRHPERSGRYVPLATVLAVAEVLRREADGMDQLVEILGRVVRQ